MQGYEYRQTISIATEPVHPAGSLDNDFGDFYGTTNQLQVLSCLSGSDIQGTAKEIEEVFERNAMGMYAKVAVLHKLSTIYQRTMKCT